MGFAIPSKISTMHRIIRPEILLCLLLLATAQRSVAQFPISTNVATSQTLSNATGTVTGSGAISIASGANIPLTMSGTSTLVNNGTIQTFGSGRAIDSNSGTANLTVTNTGLISSVSTDAFRVNTDSTVSLFNSGTIQVTAGGQAIDWAAITTKNNLLTNLGTGVISAVGEDAVRPGTNGIVNNAGSISATPTVSGGAVSGSDGIDLRTFTGISVTNTGNISGRHGIATDGSNTGPSTLTVNNNAGTISAINGSGLNVDGVSTSVTVNVTNALGATIRGGVLAAASDGDGDGIDVDGVLTLNNSGNVLGRGARGAGNNAEGLAAGGGSITNQATGVISGSTLAADAPNGDSSKFGNGILIDNSSGGNAVAATTITNSGLIEGRSGVGIKMIGTFANTVTNNAGGIISGTSTEATLQTGNGDDHVTNRGTIQNTAGPAAIALEGGNDLLQILGGAAAVSGNIDGGTGSNTLTIIPGAGNSFNFSSQITRFDSVTVGAGKFNLLGTGSVDAAVTIGMGGILGGTGTFLQSVMVQSGGSIAPGNGPGTLAILGDLNLASGAAFTFELGSLPSNSDLITISGMLNFFGPGTLIFNFVDVGLTPGSYDLMRFGGVNGLSLGNLAFGSMPSGFGGEFTLRGNSVSLNVVAVPEPSTTAGVIGLVVFSVMMARRRANKIVHQSHETRSIGAGN